MRGQDFKDSTVSKTSTKESPVQVVFDHSPPHLEITCILESLNEECRDEIKENPIDTLAGQLDILGSKDETIPHCSSSPYIHLDYWFHRTCMEGIEEEENRS